jgi:hypothetical protein
MATLWTRRQVLTQAAIAAAAVHTLDPHELCCAPSAFAQTADKDLFELKKVGDGVYAAIAATAYKVNSNAAVIMTDDGVVVVDSHSKPSAARGQPARPQVRGGHVEISGRTLPGPRGDQHRGGVQQVRQERMMSQP